MKAFIFDTETTDLIGNSLLADKHQPRVIEFYGHLVDEGGGRYAEVEFYADPGVPIPAKVTQITGITDADVRGAKPFGAYADAIQEALDDADLVVAHNLSFDRAVIEGEFRRLGRSVLWPDWQICTVEATEYILGHRLNLSRLHEHLLGEPFKGAHRARVDVEALTRCFLELLKRGDV